MFLSLPHLCGNSARFSNKILLRRVFLDHRHQLFGGFRLARDVDDPRRMSASRISRQLDFYLIGHRHDHHDHVLRFVYSGGENSRW